MFHEETFDSGEVSLNIARGASTGPPLLCLHGVLRRWSDFVPLFPTLASRWQIFGLDFRGHGESGFVPDKYLVHDYVRDAVAVVRDLLTEPVVIYGHSLGAMVAAGAAAEAPDRVRAIVLEDPPFHTLGSRIRETPFHGQFVGYEQIVELDKPAEQIGAELAELRVAVPGGNENELVRLGDLRDGASLRFSARCLSQVDPGVLAPIVAGQWLDGYDWQTAASHLQCPVLLLQADAAAGGMLTPTDAARFQQLAPQTTLVRFPGVGHLIHWMATEATVRVVGTFLESLR